MLKLSVIIRIQNSDGSASEKSQKSILIILLSIINPTKIKTGVVAAFGIAMKKGAMNRASKKHSPVTNDVIPHRPPAFTPVALSMNVMTALVPKIDPSRMANELTK